ncbi:cysteine desulfurase family protein [Chelativorans sp. M5D2P16]|uniref:cysteine desulfurase family protein n=1 Tax=Chelativorans sp. M5D2P16 TaxID=3095678 RepID=UPI002ACA6701|nr:cysteine desulfurase family protein [Chelativorans sp. M5D2P16]MDZ5697043.1 cysteine desulfurase family protein [Chelativorans sp. M5D2P16]
MVGKRIYLDYNATAPLLPAARAAVIDALEAFNPSSVHAEGRAARRIVEDARQAVAALVNGRSEHVVFASGATEAASTLLTPDWTMGRARLRFSRAYVSAADHPSLLSGGRFPAGQVERIGVIRNGLVDLDALERALAVHDKGQGLPLVAVHAANNETGVIQPVEEIGPMVKAVGGVLIVDAVQAAGRIPLDVSASYADFLILSSHKIGGPKGVGAFVGASDLMMPAALVTGGGQEKGHRAGTENVAAIAGFGAAAREAATALDKTAPMRLMRGRIEVAIRQVLPDAVIHAEAAPRLPNTVFFTIPGMKAETAQIAFDLAGIALSAGSACSSGKVGPSHVLQAMGFDDALGALRVSIGPQTQEKEIDAFTAALESIIRRRKSASAAA